MTPTEPNPSGLCMCGCGQPAPIARQGDTARGLVRGKPGRYIRGHNPAKPHPVVAPPNPSGLCMCGCGGMTTIAKQNDVRAGHAKDQPMKFIQGHGRRGNPDLYSVDPSGCWLWLRSVTRTGRPQMSVGGGKMASPHRTFYMRDIGPIPEGYHLHHTCGNTLCVNPAHGMPLTPFDHYEVHRAVTEYHTDPLMRLLETFGRLSDDYSHPRKYPPT
jgi:hypothetical protein